MKKRFGKLGLICLALVLGLAVCGIGYAHWSDSVSIETTVTTGTWCDGCSQGFWKNHLDEWGATGCNTTDDFDDTFECDAFDPDVTLLEALKLGGGGLHALGRQAVAALLNAGHPDVDYALTPGEVIDKVQQAIESGEYEATQKELEEYNAHALGGCPLGD